MPLWSGQRLGFSCEQPFLLCPELSELLLDGLKIRNRFGSATVMGKLASDSLHQKLGRNFTICDRFLDLAEMLMMVEMVRHERLACRQRR
jgi:hypothetical protein